MSRLRFINVEPDGFSAEARAILNAFCTVVEKHTTREELIGCLPEYDGLIVRLGHRIDAEILRAAPHLKVIVSPTTGLDHIDLREAQSKGIIVLSLRGETEFLTHITATAELTWGLLISLIRTIPAALESVRIGNWCRDSFLGKELSGRTLGIIGYGRLGRTVARYGLAFGMPVLVCDVLRGLDVERGVELKTFASVLAESDIITVHVPLDDTTRCLIDRRAFGCMRTGAVLINTSRGEVVDAEALIEALCTGKLAGAAIDVVSNEQQGIGTMRSHPLVHYAASHPNLLITPHIGGATSDSMRKTEIFMAEKTSKWVLEQGFGIGVKPRE